MTVININFMQTKQLKKFSWVHYASFLVPIISINVKNLITITHFHRQAHTHI